MESNTADVFYRSAQASRSGGENSAARTHSDLLASAQYADGRCAKILEPEKTLMLAILEDAVRCFQENHSARCGNGRRTFAEAQRWLFETSSDWIFSFENVCAVLGFDPQYIRRGLANWKDRELVKHRAAPLWRPPDLCSGTHG